MRASRKSIRWRWIHVIIVALLLPTVVLLVPYIFNDTHDRQVVGPELSEVSHREIFFQNGDLPLAGLLMMPEGVGPFPAAIFIHGSGTSRRNSAWYLTVAKTLQDNGIAALLPDKRGSEKSGGEWRDTSFEELATDTEAALGFMKAEPKIDETHVGIIGFSQGGWIAPIVASKNEDIAFVVSMSGAGVTTEEQLLFEETNSIVDMGTYRFVAKLIAPLTTRNIRRRDTWRAIAGFDPMPYWEQVQTPVFVAFGENDTNVPVPESVRRFEGLSRDITIEVYPDGGHGITELESGRVQPVFLRDLISFINSAVPAR